jgi:hypothetical protein
MDHWTAGLRVVPATSRRSTMRKNEASPILPMPWFRLPMPPGSAARLCRRRLSCVCRISKTPLSCAIRRPIFTTGMEFPFNRRKADDSYRAPVVVGSCLGSGVFPASIDTSTPSWEDGRCYLPHVLGTIANPGVVRYVQYAGDGSSMGLISSGSLAKVVLQQAERGSDDRRSEPGSWNI